MCGVGSIGTRHARAFAALPGVQVLVFDAVADAAQVRTRVGPGIDIVDSFEALLDRAPDGLVVATPDDAHAEPAIAACRRGIPVLLEKPVADSPRAAAGIAAEAHRTGTPMLVGYVLHHYPCLRRTRELLTAGAVGTPVSFQVMLGAYETLRLAHHRFADGRQGNLFLDYSHEWDYLRWLLGPIVGGLALAHRSGDLPLTQDPNVADVVLQLASGATGTVHLDYVQDPPSRRFTIIGDRGVLRVDVVAGDVEWTPHGVGTASVEHLGTTRDEVFQAQARHFLEVAAGRSDPTVSVADGLAALSVGAALGASTGRWTRLPAVPADAIELVES